jgi:hypothetical protein
MTYNRGCGAPARGRCVCEPVRPGSYAVQSEECGHMLRKRNLIALLMAAMLSLGTIGVAFADDGSPRTIDTPDTQTYVERDAAN